MPTNIDYAALRELCEAATPGPWADSGWEQSDYDDDYNVTRTRTWQSIKTLDPAHQGKGEQARFGDPNGGICNLEDGEYISNPLREHDGPFIAASRTALPALLDRIDAIRKLAAEAEAELAVLVNEYIADSQDGEYAYSDDEARCSIREDGNDLPLRVEIYRAVIAILDTGDAHAR